ncbi:MAG: hypothetical protein ABIY37_02775, partial [Devosia sp.]
QSHVFTTCLASIRRVLAANGSTAPLASLLRLGGSWPPLQEAVRKGNLGALGGSGSIVEADATAI